MPVAGAQCGPEVQGGVRCAGSSGVRSSARAVDRRHDCATRPGESMSSLVAYVREVVANRAAWPEVLAVLTERFALPFDDARLVMDRVQGSRGFPGVG